MFSPTSTSAMSIDKISKAVPASRPFSSTVLEMLSGFSRTALWVLAEPMVVTMPFPDSGDDGLLAGASHQAVDVGAHRSPGWWP